MLNTAHLPLPDPWRLFFKDIPVLETSSELYAHIRRAYETRAQRLVPNDMIDVWNADQDSGTLSLTFNDGREAHAKFEFMGTYDGQIFMWGDVNPSLQAPLTQTAARFRTWLTENNWVYFAKDKFSAGLRDTLALLSLAGEALDLESLFLAQSGYSSYVALILTDVKISPKTAPKTETKPKPRGMLSRIFGSSKENAPDNETEPLSPASIFDIINQQINYQVAEHQPSDDALRETESVLAAVKTQYDAGQYQDALSLLAALRPKLGDFIEDAEPAGWFFLYEGACHLALGEKAKARSAFSIAARAILVPDYAVILLGNSRCSDQEAQALSTLKAGFIYAPDWFLETANPDEITRVKNAVHEAAGKRSEIDVDPKDVLRAAIAAQYDCEITATQLSQEAEAQREDTHILSDADEAATNETNMIYRDILLTFFTARRNPSLSSYSSHPEPKPGGYDITDFKHLTEDHISALVVTKPSEGESPDGFMDSTFRYELIKTQIPLSTQPLWRVDKIWSVWPDEEILLTE